MFKIQRMIESGTIRLILIGRIGSAQLPELQELILSDGDREVVLDMAELTLVDREVVRFLMECEAKSICFANCPGYIREWIKRERGMGAKEGTEGNL